MRVLSNSINIRRAVFGVVVVWTAPQKDTDQTWEWDIKDADRRTLPLTEQVLLLLTKHYEGQPEGYSYVFVPPRCYDRI